jgi:hypothetical protein
LGERFFCLEAAPLGLAGLAYPSGHFTKRNQQLSSELPVPLLEVLQSDLRVPSAPARSGPAQDLSPCEFDNAIAHDRKIEVVGIE